MYYRFTDAVFKGMRTDTGAIVCSMHGEYSDGFSVRTDIRNLDLDHEVVYSREEPRGGSTFVPAGVARRLIMWAITKTVVNDPGYKAEMAKFQQAGSTEPAVNPHRADKAPAKRPTIPTDLRALFISPSKSRPRS